MPGAWPGAFTATSMPCGPTAHTCMLTHTYTRMHACACTHTLLTGTPASGIRTSALPGPELQPSTQHPARCPAAARTGPGGAEPHGGLQAGMQPLHPDPPASGSHLRLPQAAHQSISLVPVLAPATSSRRPAGPGKRPRAEFLQEASWLQSISTGTASGNPRVRTPHPQGIRGFCGSWGSGDTRGDPGPGGCQVQVG